MTDWEVTKKKKSAIWKDLLKIVVALTNQNICLLKEVCWKKKMRYKRLFIAIFNPFKLKYIGCMKYHAIVQPIVSIKSSNTFFLKTLTFRIYLNGQKYNRKPLECQGQCSFFFFSYSPLEEFKIHFIHSCAIVIKA